jgi:hypothetical protein
MADYNNVSLFLPSLKFSISSANTVYKMRAYSNSLGGYITWYSKNQPDKIGGFSGLEKSDLSDIVILGKFFI